MTQKMRSVMLGLGMIGMLMFTADSARGGGVAIGFGFGGGGGVHGGAGYGGYYGGGYGGYHGGGYGGHYGGSGVAWGVNVPLSSDGRVRLGVGNGGYYSPYYYRSGNYPYRGGYYGGYYNYQGGAYDYSQPATADSAQAAPAEPPLPTAGQVARMSDEQLAGLLLVASEGYSRELDDYKNGETWEKYFKLAQIIEFLKTKPNPPDAASRTTLAEVLKRLDSTAKNTEYDAVTKSWGFKTLQLGLREYALPPKERSGHLLSTNLQKISDSLGGVTTGEGWKKHLHIEELGKLAENAGENDVSQAKRLEMILAKFDAVAQNSQYQVIAELDGFAGTRAGLQRYINALQADRPAQTPPSSSAARCRYGPQLLSVGQVFNLLR